MYFIIDSDMLNGEMASLSISLVVFYHENAHVKDGHICDKKPVLVSREFTVYCVIFLYSYKLL